MQRGTFTGSPPTGISGMPVLVMDRAPDPMADRRPFWKVASVALAGGCGGVVACWSVGGASPVSSIDPAGMIGPALVGAALGVVATLACGLGMPRKVCWLFGATWGWMVSAAATMALTSVIVETTTDAAWFAPHATKLIGGGIVVGLLIGILIERRARLSHRQMAFSARIGAALGLCVTICTLPYRIHSFQQDPAAATMATLVVAGFLVAAFGSGGMMIAAAFIRNRQEGPNTDAAPILGRRAFIAILAAMFLFSIIQSSLTYLVLESQHQGDAEVPRTQRADLQAIAAQIAQAKLRGIDIITTDPSSSADVRPVSFEPLTAADVSSLEPYLRMLLGELGRHPDSVLRNSGLRRIVLVKNIIVGRRHAGGCANSPLGTVCLDPRFYTGRAHDGNAVQHELFHMVWAKVCGSGCQDPRWMELNPTGFTYHPAGPDVQFDSGLTHPSPGFVSSYGMTSPEEDQAEVFAAMQVPEERQALDRWAASDPVLRSKMKYLDDLYHRFGNAQSTTRPLLPVPAWVGLSESGRRAYQARDFPSAQRLLSQAVSDAAPVQATDSRLCMALNTLFGVYSNQGLHDKAEVIGLQVLAAQESMLGADDVEVGRTLSYLAFQCAQQGKNGDAERHYTRALLIMDGLKDPDREIVGKVLTNLANLFREQARYDEAEPLFKRALDVMRQTVGPMHINAAITLETYAHLLIATHRIGEAQALFEQAQGIRAESADNNSNGHEPARP